MTVSGPTAAPLAGARELARRIVGLVSRCRQLERADAVEQIFEQLAVGGDDVSEQPDQQDLDADDHDDAGEEQRLEVTGPGGTRLGQKRSKRTASKPARRRQSRSRQRR